MKASSKISNFIGCEIGIKVITAKNEPGGTPENLTKFKNLEVVELYRFNDVCCGQFLWIIQFTRQFYKEAVCGHVSL